MNLLSHMTSQTSGYNYQVKSKKLITIKLYLQVSPCQADRQGSQRGLESQLPLEISFERFGNENLREHSTMIQSYHLKTSLETQVKESLIYRS